MCIICNRDDNLYRKTGCKKWPRYEKKLNMDHWDEILNDLSKLKSNQLCFIGGNPLLRIERVNEIIEVSKKYGFNTFVIYSNGTIIDDNVIKILKENNIILSIQILSFNPNTLLKLGLDPQIEKEIKNNIERLIEAQVNFVVQILVNRYNEDEIDDIRNILKNEYNISNIVVDFIYKKPENTYYSEKYLNNMYTKTFTKVSKEKFNALQMWNSCFKGQLSIREDGEILICPMMRKSFGNVLKNKIYEILREKEYNEYVNMSRSTIGKCKECAYQYNCVDCRAIESAATGDIYGLEYCNIKD
ncbi:radical SAM protein [Clostridium sp. DSM 8431]|uniref:radical SAM/SPASM domain-containing protein n=1 Tax=Clostridium sp. DSM 8431 TaxID=1761781 RepID=UPI001587D8F4|nr:radical SAM protein [Clostridium sp. DSM 8431]